MPKKMVQRFFPIAYAQKTLALPDCLTQVGRTADGENGTIEVYSNPFYLAKEFRRKPSNIIDIDRIIEGEWL